MKHDVSVRPPSQPERTTYEEPIAFLRLNRSERMTNNEYTDPVSSRRDSPTLQFDEELTDSFSTNSLTSSLEVLDNVPDCHGRAGRCQW